MSTVLLIGGSLEQLYLTRVQFIESLRASGHRVCILAYPDVPVPALNGLGCEIIPVHGTRWHALYFVLLPIVLSKSPPDLVVGCGPLAMYLLPIFFAMRSIPLVLFLDAFPVLVPPRLSRFSIVFKWLVALMLRKFKKVIFSDHYLFQRAYKAGLLPESQGRVIEGDGVFITPLPELIIEKTAPFGFVLIVDHVNTPLRDYALAVQALRKKYSEEQVIFEIIIALPPGDRARFLRREAQALASLPAYRERPTDAEWPIVMESMHAIVVLQDTGGYPRVAWQAASFSKPLIAPAASFFEECLGSEEEGGVFFEAGNAQSLAEAMHRVLVSEAFQRRQKGQWLAERIAERCDNRRVLRRYREVFRELMGTRFMG